jgi:RNA-directed DNA polymerase
MKRHGGLWPRIVDADNIRAAYLRARKGKGWQRNVLRFESRLDENLNFVRDLLLSKTYKTSKYRVKLVHEPKRREIFVLPFSPDRIVQHALLNVVAPIWDNMFLHDSYCCRNRKGPHKGSNKTMVHVRKYSYCLKCDVSKFYPSIRHDVLFNIVQRKIKCPDTLWLFREIIYSPGDGVNAPIGNYTSQWFGNLYLNELDMMIKHELRCKAYLRYCDDFCLFGDDKTLLNWMSGKIENFLASRLGLRLSKRDLFPVARGVDFLGYRHFPEGYLLLRKRTAKRMRKRLRSIPAMLESGRVGLDTARSMVASARGWMRWANARNLSVSMGIDFLEKSIRDRIAHHAAIQ